MSFDPSIGQTITIAGQEYTFTEHPAAPGIPYAQSGRRGTVYQVLSASGTPLALKIFKPRFQDARNAASARQLAELAKDLSLEGLQACQRLVITSDAERPLLQRHPELQYAVLMPWVPGETWYDLRCEPLNAPQCLSMSRAFARVLARMEQRGVAHCDLSGPNVMIDLSGPSAALVDMEDLYAPWLPRLDSSRFPEGTEGYAHLSLRSGAASREVGWSEESDRFAGAVILAEMLTAFDDQVRAAGNEEHYFAQEELQTDCTRYHVLINALRAAWGDALAGLFEQAWRSRTLSECPAFSEWLAAVESAGAPAVPPSDQEFHRLLVEAGKHVAARSYQPAVLLLERAYKARPAQAAESLSNALRWRAEEKKQRSDWSGAQADFERAAALLPPGPVREEMLRRAAGLNGRARMRRKRSQSSQVRLAWKTAARAAALVAGMAVVLLVGLAAWQAAAAAQVGAVQGAAVDSVTGMSLAGAQITLHAGDQQVSAASDSSGQFVFPGLPAGSAVLTGALDGYLLEPVAVEIKAGETAVVRAAFQLTGARVSGELTDAVTGKGLSGALVTVRITASDGNKVQEQVQTDPSGSYSVLLAASGNGTIDVQAASYQSPQPVTFRARAGEAVQIPKIQLQPNQ